MKGLCICGKDFMFILIINENISNLFICCYLKCNINIYLLL